MRDAVAFKKDSGENELTADLKQLRAINLLHLTIKKNWNLFKVCANAIDS